MQSIIEPKIAHQMGKRGWTTDSLESVIANPSKTVVTKDTRFDPVSGTRLNDPATGYVAKDGSYVVRNDQTGAIVQVSDKMIKTGSHHGSRAMKEFVFLGFGPEPTRLWGGTPLFNLSDSHELLNYCDTRDAAVLGIEGFKIVGDKRIPDLDCIADFSALAVAAREAFPALSRKSARDFIESISDRDIFLEFVLVRV